MLTISAGGQNQGGKAAIDPAGIQRLQADTGGAARVSINRATGAVRFVRLPAGKAGDLAPASVRSARAQEKSKAFFRQYGSIFGLTQPDKQLKEMGRQTDRTGATHITYRQYYAGVPVFGGILKAHFDAKNQLRSVNGTTLPNLAVVPAPARSAGAAAKTALSAVSEQKKGATGLVARRTQLYVFQAGLAKGVDLGTHLVWEVEISNRGSVREFVYVDAHNGKIVDQITGTPDNLYRRAYDGLGLDDVPPSYPNNPVWVEGDNFPTGVVEEDNMLYASFDTYYFYLHAFGRDSFDDAGAIMDQIFNRGYGCPNASWNGIFISFCPGFTADDVTAHEWTHAYTEYTDGLIYQWQPGALNESYSDIFGETVDKINNRGTDTPDAPRTAGACSSFSPPRVVVDVNSPFTDIFPAQSAQFGPTLTQTGVTGDVVYASPADGCTTVSGSVSGKIALIDRGTCTFVIKVKNAQNAGATGVIIANNVASGLPGMGGSDATITIPSLGITQADGNTIKQSLSGGTVNVTLHASSAPTDNSYRWLMGEDVTPGGAIRDMWTPACYANPGKVTDYAYYVCDSSDGGGVHTNSGVPNHAYALLVDGGTYNGHTVASIGLTKAAHIYYRAMSVYQVPSTDFADHADALEQSCADLLGVKLPDIRTGAVFGQRVTSKDCAAVSEAIAAVQLRTAPTQCSFKPLLAKNPPPHCAAGETEFNVRNFDFESNPLGSWTVSHEAVSPTDFTLHDWEWQNTIPDRSGSAFFVSDPDVGTCAPGGDQSGVRHLTSPVINIPADSPKPFLAFQHWIGSEPGWDGGNLWIRVNGGPWQFVKPGDFTFNTYNLILNPAAAGNTNPLAGLPAFSGSDGGVVTGSWGWSYVDMHKHLPNTAGTKPYTLQFRWDFGNDGCGGFVGWYLDDVTVYACRP
ncbi:MAG: M4 family metallopeptidase [Chlamydiota bacterium]